MVPPSVVLVITYRGMEEKNKFMIIISRKFYLKSIDLYKEKLLIIHCLFGNFVADFVNLAGRTMFITNFIFL